MRWTDTSFADLSDDQLLAAVKRLAATELRATAALIQSLMELDARRLYLGAGCSSLFSYCTQVLRLAEGAAYNRIEAARAARRFPSILESLADGSLTLTAVRLLAPHLTVDNHLRVLASARHMCKLDIERLVASLNPKPDVPAVIRKLPEPRRGVTDGSTTVMPLLPTSALVPQAAAAPANTADGYAARAAPLQDPAHHFARHTRQAAPRAGPRTAHGPERRPRRDLRSRPDAAAA
jgi:hypothetical protein